MLEEKALIWDYDGTLVDSYEIIVNSICEVLDFNRLKCEKKDIYDFVKKKSVNDFFEEISKKTTLNLEELKTIYTKFRMEHLDEYKLIPHAKETLETLSKKNVRNFVYTHSSKSAITVLNNLGIAGYFEEIITRESGFPRKPDGKALDYIVNKYNLKKNNTYYIGDRIIDVQCANNSAVLSILYDDKLPYVGENYRIRDLNEISNILYINEKEIKNR